MSENFKQYFAKLETFNRVKPPEIDPEFFTVHSQDVLQNEPNYFLQNISSLNEINPNYSLNSEDIEMYDIDINLPDEKLDKAKKITADTSKVKSTPSFGSKEKYVKTMYKYLYNALEKNGINGSVWAPVLVAHTAIESNWGNEFSRRNNNFAGIKGKGSGKTSTKEYISGKGYVTIKDSFKSYSSIEAFADDYVKMLKNKFNAFVGTTNQYLSNIRSKHYFTARLEDYQRIFNPTLSKVYNYLKS